MFIFSLSFQNILKLCLCKFLFVQGNVQEFSANNAHAPAEQLVSCFSHMKKEVNIVKYIS